MINTVWQCSTQTCSLASFRCKKNIIFININDITNQIYHNTIINAIFQVYYGQPTVLLIFHSFNLCLLCTLFGFFMSNMYPPSSYILYQVCPTPFHISKPLNLYVLMIKLIGPNPAGLLALDKSSLSAIHFPIGFGPQREKLLFKLTGVIQQQK